MARRSTRPADRHQRRAHQGPAHGYLRNGRAHRDLGCVGEADDSGADGGRPRVRGGDSRGRLECQGLSCRRDRQRRGARGLRPLPELPGRSATPLQGHQGDRREPTRGVCRVPVPADDECLGPRLAHCPGRPGDLRPVRQRGAHGPPVRRARRGRLDHRCRADRDHGGEGRPPRRGAARRHHRRQSVPPRAGTQDGSHAAPSTSASGRSRASRTSSV